MIRAALRFFLALAVLGSAGTSLLAADDPCPEFRQPIANHNGTLVKVTGSDKVVHWYMGIDIQGHTVNFTFLPPPASVALLKAGRPAGTRFSITGKLARDWTGKRNEVCVATYAWAQ